LARFLRQDRTFAKLAVAPSQLQLERGPLFLNSRRALWRLLLLAPGRWRLAFRFQLRQPEFDLGYGVLNRFELVTDALGGSYASCRLFRRDWRYHMQIVDCERCDPLLADYKRSVGFFTKAVQRIPGVLGDNSMAAEVVDRLRKRCQDAREDLMAHWLQEHSDSRQTIEPR